MSYVLKENNAFYGSKGNIISNQLYDRLPSQHQLLFEKCDSNNNYHDKLMDRIKKVSIDINKIKNPVKNNVHYDGDMVYVENDPDEDWVLLEDYLKDELEDNEPF